MRRTAAALPDKELTHCRANLKVAAAAAAFASQPWLACLVCLGPLGHGCKRVGSKEPGQGGQAEWLLLLGLLLGLAPSKEEHAEGVNGFARKSESIRDKISSTRFLAAASLCTCRPDSPPSARPTSRLSAAVQSREASGRCSCR